MTCTDMTGSVPLTALLREKESRHLRLAGRAIDWPRLLVLATTLASPQDRSEHIHGLP